MRLDADRFARCLENVAELIADRMSKGTCPTMPSPKNVDS